MIFLEKLYFIIGPIRIYGTTNFLDTFNELLKDLNFFCHRRDRKINLLRFLFYTFCGIILFPISTILNWLGYRVVFGTGFNQIGDAVFLDGALKRQILLRSSKKLILILGRSEQGNNHLIKKYSKYVKILKWPSFFSIMWSLFSYNPLLREDIVNFNSLHTKNRLSKVQRIWSKKKLKPLLSPEKYNNNWNNLPDFLISHFKARNFVCIHSRDIGFYNNKTLTTRNYDIRTLTDLIQKLTKEGIAVVRIGKNPEFKINTKNLIKPEYYFDSCNIVSPDQDIFFLSNCIFYIGCSSGPAEVPGLFGLNCFLINVYPTVNGKKFVKGDLSIFKKIKNISSNKYINIEKYFAKPFDLPLQHQDLEKIGYKLENNTSEEIMKAFEEFTYSNRNLYSSLYKKLFDKINQDQLSILQSDTYNIDKYFKPYHWTFRSLGMLSKIFVKEYMSKQE